MHKSQRDLPSAPTKYPSLPRNSRARRAFFCHLAQYSHRKVTLDEGGAVKAQMTRIAEQQPASIIARAW